MCGFAVIMGFAGRLPDRGCVERMVGTLAHRGPDDAGFWSGGPVAMGFRRLAIIDRSLAAHQPMLGPGGNEVLVDDPSGNVIELFQPTLDYTTLARPR